jgi:RNA polymerase sigma-70 factor (ECF subfamily)
MWHDSVTMTGERESDARTDDELLEAVRTRNDRGALEALLERHEPAIWRFGMKMCRDPEDAKDVLQETMLAAARTARDFRGGSRVSTWLFAIARSFCIKKRRRSQLAPGEPVSLDEHSERVGDIATSDLPPDEAVASRELGLALDRALGELEPAQREVLILRDVEGLSAAEVAEVLGVSVDAVKSRLHRARVLLRERLSPFLPPPEPAPTPSCPEIVPLFSRYLEGEIGAQECASIEEHVETCPRCRGACDALKQTLSLCRARATRGTVPGDVQERVRSALHDLAGRFG